jgi:cobalt transporter subunit CbtA
MALFQRLIWGALAVALLVGSAQTALQQWLAVPIILAAETFEAQKTVPPAAAGDGHNHDHDHAHEAAEAGAPADGLERTAWTWVANLLHAFSLALLVFVVMGLWVWRRGAAAAPFRVAFAVAAAGWLSLHLWPSLGLPAEVPGMDAAGLGSRQGWWLLAAGCAALACASAACWRTHWRWLAAAAWLAVPFVWGAPHLAGDPLAGFGAEAQAQLHALGAQFVWVTGGIALTLWASLGAACGAVFQRWLAPALAAASPAPALRAARNPR